MMKTFFTKKMMIIAMVTGVLVLGGVSAITAYALNAGTVSKEEAVKSVSEQVNGEVIKVERDLDDTLTYEMTMKTENGYEDVEVNASNGEMIEREYDDDNDDSHPAAKISLEEAEKIALKEVANGTITDVELDMENGLLVYEIEVEKKWLEYDLVIDANTGDVLHVGKED
ncbi:propeptide, PepSY amd peptidase M4, putative [beta proteobacterium KB13] [Peribacillus asahii]|uniref:Propeptide, PepSY amd peptidase M4, putative [beta proteobacterium KB13] n=1 Tax=Peribacillus asahii TaxID=228899 RepID=A0A3Q9RRP3_9BACI|nr:PepSY domain-containing protein [Peribacillus asahii]AZV45122.1 propeptide, PepSY amd peptidase M4, putative [beta proteobacterium KB13] [Peribacillus asahii]